VGALGHFLERQGIATASISLVREHTETIRPPRALWVTFELGRPLGIPDDADFQRRVLRATAKLLERTDMPLGWARAIFVLDASWVAISAVLLMLPASWTLAGIAGIVVVALIVADLAILEYLGLRRISTAN